ncbi:hypothetical protein BO82DRAFT_405041 [Aspergillus uvarum CBS 121591]|uniref:FAD linked oxidase N-terminal domain-containing protein n=1 Tax=Aspergillus uvarum CBS 121591 TaxID=1448315 RepID=A0A319CSQ4_9EURO|nr:hypothetical protein BO82DRAFT_405041 [Aspergillus uvarum CBS 121591]PYH78598.1 hypothetical protein BO82DRAFT_405041 [Aspergillus uvarum CBS 121591]
MTDDLARQRLQKLAGFFANNPSIQYVTPSSPKYAELCAAYVSLPDLNPLAIARPSTVEAAVSVVSFVVANDIPFTEFSTARIGEGILGGDMIRALQKHGLTAAVGTISSVGYAGWAMCGGYGPGSWWTPMRSYLGPSVARGEHSGLSSSSSQFRHRLDQTLDGAIAFQSDNLPAVIRQYNSGYQALSAEGIPAELTLQQSILNLPHGKTLVVLFVWASSDIETGQSWAEKICALAPVTHYAVQPTTPLTYLTDTD